MSATLDDEPLSPLAGRRVAFVGKLGGMNRREAQQVVRRLGGTLAEPGDDALDLIVIGADELPLGADGGQLDEKTRTAAAEGRLAIVSETQFWQQLGLVENEQHLRQLYTPAMLADLLGLPVAVVRGWHRRGLIVPAREIHRLPYFDFREVTHARQLARLVAAGASPSEIQRQLAELARYMPEAERPLAQLPVLVEGRQLLLRKDGGLIDAAGQLRLDFDALEEDAPPPIASGAPPRELTPDMPITPDELLSAAAEAEEIGDLAAAIDLYRASLAATGPTPEAAFHLAELLYRAGEPLAARERYYLAIELDENYVEARASLGSVLAELGQADLAMAAFEGALAYHPDYPDAHFHLARLLEDAGRSEKAQEHWRAFLALAPDSPWAEEAQHRLEGSGGLSSRQ